MEATPGGRSAFVGQRVNFFDELKIAVGQTPFVVRRDFNANGSKAEHDIGVVIDLFGRGSDLVDEFEGAPERRELPGPDEHVAEPLPPFRDRKPVEDLRFTEFGHEIPPFRRERARSDGRPEVAIRSFRVLFT